MKKSIIISTLLCVLMCITTFAWAAPFDNATSGNYTDSSIDDSDSIIVNIGGDNSGDIHVGDNDTVADQDEVICEECLKATFDGSSMVLVLPRVEYFDPGLFRVTTWFMEIDFSTGKPIITDTHLVE